MSHQPTRTSDIASEWPEERERKSSKVTSTSKSISTIRSVTSTSRTSGNTSQTKYGKNGEPEIDVDVDIDVDVEMNDEDDVAEEHDEAEEWDARSCLFCPQEFMDFDKCLEHKEEKHGFHIPEKHRLIVDEETLLSYCHVVIHRYLECIKCGTRRQTLKPLQAHMRDKGHCGFEVGEGSDFSVFYNFEDGSVEGVEEEAEYEEITKVEVLEDVGDGQVRLPSGRVMGSKTYRAPRPVKEPKDTNVEMLQDGSNPSVPSLFRPATSSTSSTTSSPASTALSRADKRNLTHSNQLSHLRHTDALQLAHLPAAQQRAVLSTQKKQVAKERRAQTWMEGRVKGKGNKFLQANYRADGPGRANG